MIEPAAFLRTCQAHGVDFFAGVPDSLLKELNAEIMATVPRERHVIAANEGAAVGLAIGHHLATGDVPAVYLQNSGYGNLVNPLLSLADPDVYGIPMVLIIGWRGQPGVSDEPQHVKQGRIMEPLTEALGMPWQVLAHDPDTAAAQLATAVSTARQRSTPYVLLVEKGTFAKSTVHPDAPGSELPSREEALVATASAIGDGHVLVSTTGMLSRELFEHRQAAGPDQAADFLTVGGMGHASSIACGVAMRRPDRQVWCLDGDGALLMHLGNLAVIADHAPPNFFHVVFNNGVHDSVGGQPTSIRVVDIPTVARGLGYRHATTVTDLGSLPDAVAQARGAGGPILLELRVRPGNRADIGRPTRTPAESKKAFMSALDQS